MGPEAEAVAAELEELTTRSDPQVANAARSILDRLRRKEKGA